MSYTILKSLPTPTWLSSDCDLSIVQFSDAIAPNLITSVHCFCFRDDEILFVHNRRRGWDIPGGHIETGESIADAVQRELEEEANIRVTAIKNLAAFMIKNNGSKPAGNKYPHPLSFLTFHTAKIDRLDPFIANVETDERKLVKIDSASQIDWVGKHKDIFDLAVRSAGLTPNQRMGRSSRRGGFRFEV